MKIPEAEYFCPQCGQGFDVPAAWLSPCCGAPTNGGEDYTCPGCGQEFESDREVPQCPNCGNFGGGIYLEPGCWDCCGKEIEYWEMNGGGE